MRVAAYVGGVVMMGLVVGCGGEEGEETATPTATAASAADVQALLEGGASRPVDTAPGPGATTFYFVGQGDAGPGVFSVSGEGGIATLIASAVEPPPPARGTAAEEDPPENVPMVAPNGIAVKSDGTSLYFVDSELFDGQGAVVAVNIAAGTAVPVVGTIGLKPMAIDLVEASAGDEIWFTGTSVQGAQPALFRVAAEGGAPTVVLRGSPLVRPTGVVVDAEGVAYVADEAAAGQSGGTVFAISQGSATSLLSPVITGEPAGVALTLDETVLLISAHDPADGSDQVILLDLGTGASSTFTDVISANYDGGGVHRAPDMDVFGWADLSAGATGQVYKITLK